MGFKSSLGFYSGIAFGIGLIGLGTPRADIISGRIVDAAAMPLTGARVALAPRGISVVTGADGLFALTVPGTGIGRSDGSDGNGSPAFEFSLRNNRLHLRTTGTQDVDINVYSLAGSKVAAIFHGSLPAGEQAIPMQGWDRDLAPGLYLLAVRIGGSWSYARIGTRTANQPVALFKRSAMAAAEDTLVISKTGYYARKSVMASMATQNMGDLPLQKDRIRTGSPLQDQYNKIIVESVDKRGLDTSLYMIIKAMIVIESSFNANAISMYDVQLPCGTHSYGLIQVTPGCERGYATLPAGTPVTATISGGLNGNPAVLAYANPADKESGNTVVKENNIIINLVSNPANPFWPTSAFNPAYSIDNGVKALNEVRAEMKKKFAGCSEANYLTMALAGYNQGASTVSGCTSFSGGGVTYSTNVLNQYRSFCKSAGIVAVY